MVEKATHLSLLEAQDNYSWLIHEPERQVTAVVDPAEVAPVVKALEAK